MPKPILPLSNTIQKYVWGSKTYIPQLLGQDVPSKEPQAEMWMGAHPKAPSEVDGEPLNKVIDEATEDILGSSVANAYDGRLPFLFKLLAAGTPLSIQAHPNKQQAEEGFARENAAGIPLDAPHRNYKDDNHKPEILCALSEFWGLNGFREIAELLRLFKVIPLPGLQAEISAFEAQPDTGGLQRFFGKVMKLPEPRKEQVIGELLTWAGRNPDLGDEPHWIQRGYEVFGNDIGLLCILMLNLVKLKPGEAMYCAAGDLHAYLDGFGVELMANSDNVLRGGCTVKHIDVPELMRVLTFADRPAKILRPDEDGVYPTPAPEFQLTRIQVGTDTSWSEPAGHAVEIAVCTEGQLTLANEVSTCPLEPGHSALIPAAAGAWSATGCGTLYKAGVGSANA